MHHRQILFLVCLSQLKPFDMFKQALKISYGRETRFCPKTDTISLKFLFAQFIVSREYWLEKH